MSHRLSKLFPHGMISHPVFGGDGSIWVNHTQGIYRIFQNRLQMVLAYGVGQQPIRADGIHHIADSLIPVEVQGDQVFTLCTDSTCEDTLIRCSITDGTTEALRLCGKYRWVCADEQAVYLLGWKDVRIVGRGGAPHVQIPISDERIHAYHLAEGRLYVVLILPTENGCRLHRMEIGADGTVCDTQFYDISLRNGRLDESDGYEKLWVYIGDTDIIAAQPIGRAEFVGLDVYHISKAHPDQVRKYSYGPPQAPANAAFWQMNLCQGWLVLTDSCDFYGYHRAPNTPVGEDFFTRDDWIYARLWRIDLRSPDAPEFDRIPEPVDDPTTAFPPLRIADGVFCAAGRAIKDEKKYIARWDHGKWFLQSTPEFDDWVQHQGRVFALRYGGEFRKRPKIFEVDFVHEEFETEKAGS